jgi:hypothetical protein
MKFVNIESLLEMFGNGLPALMIYETKHAKAFLYTINTSFFINYKFIVLVLTVI